MIRDLVMNFIKKYKELDAELKRKKFAITICLLYTSNQTWYGSL